MAMLYTFSTTHAVILAEQGLLQMKLPVTVMPVPNEITAGCGLCLRIPSEYRVQAENEMRKEPIMLSAIYQWQEADGIYQLVKSLEES